MARIAARQLGTPLGIATKASLMLGLLLFAKATIAQNARAAAARLTPTETLTTATELPAQTARPTSAKIAAGPPRISYVDGQLRIDALDATMADVLTKVGALTGVNIDIPPGANSERMHIVELGPGPARQILASLLSDSNFDYLIQASDTDPERIQNVLIMPREKKGSGINGTDAGARPSRSPYARTVAPPAISEEAPVPDTPVPAQPGILAAEANPSNPQPAPPEESMPPSLAEPDKPVQFPLSQTDQSNSARAGGLTPPQTLSPQSISQQLQQMYQQRVQMNQQGQTVPPAVRP